VRLGRLPKPSAERARRLLDRFPSPPRVRVPSRAEVLEAIGRDKKGTRFVVLTAIGRAVVEPRVPPRWVEAAVDGALAALRGGG